MWRYEFHFQLNIYSTMHSGVSLLNSQYIFKLSSNTIAMNSLLLCFFVFLTLALSSVAQYDFFMMAMQWPPAVCRPKHAKCVKSPGSHFTIHGLWPQNHTDPQPRACSKRVRNPPNFITKMVSIYIFEAFEFELWFRYYWIT
jgi:hypothetical protein